MTVVPKKKGTHSTGKAFNQAKARFLQLPLLPLGKKIQLPVSVPGPITIPFLLQLTRVTHIHSQQGLSSQLHKSVPPFLEQLAHQFQQSRLLLLLPSFLLLRGKSLLKFISIRAKGVFLSSSPSDNRFNCSCDSNSGNRPWFCPTIFIMTQGSLAALS